MSRAPSLTVTRYQGTSPDTSRTVMLRWNVNARRSNAPSPGVPRRGSGLQTTSYGTFVVSTVTFTPVAVWFLIVAVHARARLVAFARTSTLVSSPARRARVRAGSLARSWD